ncbi:MAG: hypothetical protein COV76_08245 [Candidatus Omnitrophica bacterium CG11_big_fil_rev_8_21_14_0_20_64_10]|nr:MAG: hypothetical protein COV76_08245 [Candidatus Omnitrophica bacterium CG11_big_fil_rev_8_21_14_0_20_64_10]
MLALVLVAGFGMIQPSVLLAGEHGGKEHGGTAPAAAGQEGSHGMEMSEAALLKEAATALRKGQSRPDLAEKLEKLAKSHTSN